ncbi:hypothetical protein J7E88_01580 [Streptomyces sp. ISL-10]|uniref:hypothetical protein n=1 Tax=Streptomyces sp. ISL-10 TaxID=2819172 RepID=UPI001BE6ADCA|nr:hypothetical protein [Streptomyces sp. ISL-10]MBT2364056.1 hypothetical protein [Streptomyces sp. ISL-10]
MQLRTIARSQAARKAAGAATVGLLATAYASPAAGQETVKSPATVNAASKSDPKDPAASIATVAGVPISPTATSTTRTIAASDPQAVQATSNLCGSGYYLQYAEQLPDERRWGTLFTYQRNVAPFNSCAIFDNNLGTTKYMKLKLCPNDLSKPCSVDEGNFSQYAARSV